MQYESQWPGDAIAAPAYTLGERYAIHTAISGGSRRDGEHRSFCADAGLRRFAPNRLPGESAAHNDPGGHLRATGRRRSVAIVPLLMEGFALYGAAFTHSEFLWLPRYRPSVHDWVKDSSFHEPAGTTQTDLSGRRWVYALISFFTEMWSGRLRRREIRRLTAAWEQLDERTLKDIGVSRHEIEYARPARHRS